ncbi:MULTISPECIES: cell division protein FtsQ/DivIB [unclassified Paludibacterium]|uniref:cell division protein FtsQ/DivIB n=1 Tax=unclassified Paludibacterium TaxID=2618429 RepID=UPI001C058C1E|nr:cell division protein FtsQ/DivIB [Paludibacterium sp. B53371]BEV72499.1 cell division protein FtsQ/DivIB [Paludibacterium sp. THUN1379]
MWDNHIALRRLANLLLLVSIGMLLYAGGFWVTHAPVFPVKKIRITGKMQRVTPEQLKFIAEHELTGSFFTLDIDRTRAAFGKLPWVRGAQVRRTWPDTLEISIDEYAALSRWGEDGLVDVNGTWFDAASDQNDLPVFYGPAGAQKDMAQMYQRLKQDFALADLKIVRLVLSDRRAWSVELDNGVHIELGRGDVENRALRFTTHWKGTLARLPYPISYVDMRYPNGFAVRMPGYQASQAAQGKK